MEGEDESVRFSVDAALLFELGERLVSRKSIALAELIKNAYDADATEVIVTLENVKSDHGTVVIEDNGNGMTSQNIKDHWMRIATDDKTRNPVSPKYGRNRTGAKGIGRFATRRLADRLRVHTIAQVDGETWEETTVSFDWSLYQSGMTLGEVPNAMSSRRMPMTTRTGTRLYLENLRDGWSRAEVDEVRNDLLDLTPPGRSTSSGDPGFAILFIVPEYPESEGDVFEEFLKTALGVLTAIVQPDGTPQYTYAARGEPLTGSFGPKGVRFPGLVGAQAIIRHFVFKPSYFRGTDFDISAARSIGRLHGGVRVYMDRFKVFPYGAPGNDWLGLDEDRAGRRTPGDAVLKSLLSEGRRRVLLDLPGNNQLFGEVHVSRALHSGLMPTISRTGLVENDVFEEMKHFVRLGIDWMTIQRRNYEERQKPVTPPESRRPIAEIVEGATKQIESTLTGKVSRLDLAEVSRVLEDVRTAVRASDEEHVSKIAMLRTLASAGTMVLIFTHQIRAVIDEFKGVVTDLYDETLELTSDHFLRMRDRLRLGTDVVEAQARLLGFLLGEDSRRRRRRLVLRPLVEDLTGAFGRYCSDYGIEMNNSVPQGVRMPPMYEAEIHSVLLNLLTNSLKAVREREDRRIDISAVESPQEVTVLVKDTGGGIPLSLREWVFDAFATTSKPDPVLGVGTGLGLTIVRDIISDYGGKVRFIDAETPWSICAEVTIPTELEE